MTKESSSRAWWSSVAEIRRSSPPARCSVASKSTMGRCEAARHSSPQRCSSTIGVQSQISWPTASAGGPPPEALGGRIEVQDDAALADVDDRLGRMLDGVHGLPGLLG